MAAEVIPTLVRSLRMGPAGGGRGGGGGGLGEGEGGELDGQGFACVCGSFFLRV